MGILNIVPRTIHRPGDTFPFGSISFIFIQFSAKILSNKKLSLQDQGLAPGSTTAFTPVWISYWLNPSKWHIYNGTRGRSRTSWRWGCQTTEGGADPTYFLNFLKNPVTRKKIWSVGWGTPPLDLSYNHAVVKQMLRKLFYLSHCVTLPLAACKARLGTFCADLCTFFWDLSQRNTILCDGIFLSVTQQNYPEIILGYNSG